MDYYYKVFSEDVRELPIYLPSIVGQMWDPETAIDRHVQQDNRVDIKMIQKRIIPKMGKSARVLPEITWLSL